MGLGQPNKKRRGASSHLHAPPHGGGLRAVEQRPRPLPLRPWRGMACRPVRPCAWVGRVPLRAVLCVVRPRCLLGDESSKHLPPSGSLAVLRGIYSLPPWAFLPSPATFRKQS